jgi:segregation and condensation protein B
VPPSQLAKLLSPRCRSTPCALLDELAREWSSRKVELVQVASGWRFQGRREIQHHLDRLALKTPRYSR